MASADLQEKVNFTRLSRLLVDKGTEALRNTFDGIHAPASLSAVLNANKTSLLRLKPELSIILSGIYYTHHQATSQNLRPLMSPYLQFYFGTFAAFRKQDGV